MTQNSKDKEHQLRKDLIQKASAAAKRAYAPYSKFRVGAALLDDRGNHYTGCNIENASYGASCCAERTAIFTAIASGSRQISRLAVVCEGSEYCRPCGICRQVMAEFAAADFELISARPDGQYQCLRMEDLLPHAFSKESMQNNPERKNSESR